MHVEYCDPTPPQPNKNNSKLKGKWSSGQRVKTVPGCFSLFVIHLKTHYISSLM